MTGSARQTVRNLGLEPSLLGVVVAEMRSVAVQGDRQRFRRNLERLGELMGYEISKELSYVPLDVRTPLGTARCVALSEQPVLATILRASLPMHQGLLHVFDQADNAFISAFRKPREDSGALEVEVEYLSSPSVEGRTVILCDPMLATGTSMVLAWQALLERGTPRVLHVVSAIASEAGVAYVQSHLPEGTTFWFAAIDAELNSKAYIVPGLGDAGDLAYGEKE